jgi:hypothetical protein
MPRKNALLPVHLLSGQSMGASVTGPWTDIGWLDNLVFNIAFTGTPTGTFAVQASPDQTLVQQIELSGTPTASGAADDIRIEMNQVPDKFIRLVYTRTSGTGTLSCWISGKEV